MDREYILDLINQDNSMKGLAQAQKIVIKVRSQFSGIVVGLFCAISLTGCGASLFSFRQDNPAIQDITVSPHFWPWSKTGLNTFSTTASRRMVIAKQEDYGDKITTCAEPPPDVGEAFASAIADSFKLAGTEPRTGLKEDVSNDYARAVATQITPLVYRTQGLQLYRNAMHDLCIDNMNGMNKNTGAKPISLIIPTETLETTTTDKKTGNSIKKVEKQHDKVVINPDNYNEMKLLYFIKAIDAVKEEIPAMEKAQQVFFKNVKAGMSIGSVTELIRGLGGVQRVCADNSTPVFCSDKEPADYSTTPPTCKNSSVARYCKSGLLPEVSLGR